MTYTNTPVIDVDGLTHSYGSTTVLDGLDLVLPAGVHALLGPNGAGKTTLVNILTTVLRPDGGSAQVLGVDVATGAAELRRRISVTGQFAAVDGVLTGEENLVMVGRLLGLSSAESRRRAGEQLERFDLGRVGDRRVDTYSGGMRRRLDLAVSLVHPPELLFLDEPTTGLDTRSRRELWEQIGALARDGMSVLLTTQYLEEADELADRIAVLDGGRVVAEGSAAELKARVGGAVLQVRDARGTMVREVATDGSVVALAEAAARVAAEDPALTIEVHRPTLDDAFLALTGRAPSVDDGADHTGARTLAATGARR